jgi:hypothetical protein
MVDADASASRAGDRASLLFSHPDKAKSRTEGYRNLGYELFAKALADDLRRVCGAARPVGL